MKYLSTLLLLCFSLSLLAHNGTTPEDAKRTEVRVFPNPVSTYLEVSHCDEIVQLKLYNLTGKMVRNETNTCKIQLDDLPIGIYIVKIEMENTTISRKIVKNQ